MPHDDIETIAEFQTAVTDIVEWDDVDPFPPLVESLAMLARDEQAADTDAPQYFADDEWADEVRDERARSIGLIVASCAQYADVHDIDFADACARYVDELAEAKAVADQQADIQEELHEAMVDGDAAAFADTMSDDDDDEFAPIGVE